MIELQPTHPLIERSGRWSQSSSATLTASWCSTSLRFFFSGQSLRIRPGKHTERKDPWNGGVPMLVWIISPEDSENSGPHIVESADAEPLKEIILIDGDHVLADRLCCIQIMLVDWASVFEIEAIIVESQGGVHQGLTFRYTISDKENGQPTRGYYDAFPAVAQRLLREQEKPFSIQIDTIAYPGITLVNPTESEAEEGMARGMVDRFFHCSPWDATPLTEYEHPSVIIISLGANDEANSVSAERFTTTLYDFIKRLLQLFPTSLRCLCVIHPFQDFTELEPSSLASSIPAVLDRIRQESRDLEGLSLHHFSMATAMSRHLTEDGLHPTTDGHKLTGQNLARELSAILPIRRDILDDLLTTRSNSPHILKAA